MKIETPPKSGNYIEIYKHNHDKDKIVLIIDSVNSFSPIRRKMATLLSYHDSDSDGFNNIYKALLPLATLVEKEVDLTDDSRVVDLYFAGNGDLYLIVEGRDSDGYLDQVTGKIFGPGKNGQDPEPVRNLYNALYQLATRM